MKKRICAFVLIMLMMTAVFVPTAGATEQTIESTTTTTAAAPAVSINKFYVLGSNGKYYNPYPSLSTSSSSYSFTVPDWMEECTVCIESSAASSVECSGAEVSSSGSTYELELKLENNTTKITADLKGDGGTRSLTITVRKDKIDCYIDTLRLLDANKEAITPTSGTVADGLVYTFASGTKSVPLRMVARHENEVWLENLTTDSTGTLVGGTEAKKQLELEYSRYDTQLALIEGTNKFKVTVSAGTVTVTCDIEIIVGDAAANAIVTTTSTTTTTTAPTTAPTAATTAAPSSSGNLLGVFSNMSTGMGILIGIIITVIIGAFIFMIVNMSSGSDRRDDYSEPSEPLYRPRRRNLSDYADDEYYDDYGVRGIGRGRQDDYYGYDERPRRRERDYYDDYYQQDSRPQNGRFYDYYARGNDRYGYEDDNNY